MDHFDGRDAKRQRIDDNQSFGVGNYYNTDYSNLSSVAGGERKYAANYEETPNHILLITVMNAAYPITTDILYKLCSPSGKVQRIVIFRKNGVQAMVEFDCIDSAESAKRTLNGCDIYQNCCTLKIEFAKTTKLNVYRNDSESWDYTNDALGKTNNASDRPALLQEPPRGYGSAPPAFSGAPAYGGYPPRAPMPDRYVPPTLPSYPPARETYTAPPLANRYEEPNHILLLTVINPAYPIATDLIHTLCSPSGKVQRIVIFRKNGVQALVEFDCVNAAESAKQALHGCDIYPGSCTLKIEFAKSKKLNVYKNDNESWDYTNSALGKTNPNKRPALLQEPPCGYGVGDYGGGPGYGPGGYMNPQGNTQQFSPVMMVYGLNHEKMNADKLFNIVCLYGNVLRINFLKTKEGCAMVQMGDPLSVKRTVANLNETIFFDTKLQLGYSKQAYLNDVQQPFALPDGTPSFKDYMDNRNNRFTNAEAASRNRILPPGRILHFYNVPSGFSEEEMKKVFETYGATPPSTVETLKSKSEKSSSGLLEFENVSDAMEALAFCNHHPIPNPNSKYPFILKLCFSSSGNGRGPRSGGNDNNGGEGVF